MTRSPARNSCLNKCSLLSRPPIHEQIYNQEDLGLSHRHLFNNFSNNFPSPCGNCSDDHLFKCLYSGVDICLNINYKCDGDRFCDDFSDELVLECPNCVDDPSKFTCSAGGEEVCWNQGFRCDGRIPNCDGGSDEDPAACGNCTNQPGFAMCRDGNSCFMTPLRRCNGGVDCTDGSDESDTYSQCDHCTEQGSLPCPGFPGNCGKLCDGIVTCPDKWDELLSTCKSNSVEVDADICSIENDLFQCEDDRLQRQSKV